MAGGHGVVAFTAGGARGHVHGAPCLQAPLNAVWFYCFVGFLLFLISASFLAFVTSPSLLGVGTKRSSHHHLPTRPIQETCGVSCSCGSSCTRPRTEASTVHTAPSSLWVQRRPGVHCVTPAEEPALFLKPSRMLVANQGAGREVVGDSSTVTLMKDKCRP